MDEEIKRLLKLSNIPNFKLLPKEEKKLKEWKEQQVDVKPKKRIIPDGYTELQGIGANGRNTIISVEEELEIPKKKKKSTHKKTTNVVAIEDKENNSQIEES